LAEPFPGRAPRRPAVLVVDDNPAVGETLGAWLRAHGLGVWLAAGGPEAVELFRVCGEVDLVLMEVYMPGWDGPRTLAALRRLNPRLPCCFMSGHAGHYPPRALRELGGAGLFRKPFHCAEVARALRRLLGGP
jgi:two-component system, OmpR family, response regulator